MKHKGLVWMLIGLMGLGLAGCAQARPQVTSTSSRREQTSQQRQKQPQKIRVLIDGQTLTAQLNTSSAARALARRLPLTLTFRNYAGLPEKIADLKQPLPTNGMPSGHAGIRGSIGYWSPDQRLVFYWGQEDYYEGIHIIGHFETTAARQTVKAMGNHQRVRLELAE